MTVIRDKRTGLLRFAEIKSPDYILRSVGSPQACGSRIPRICAGIALLGVIQFLIAVYVAYQNYPERIDLSTHFLSCLGCRRSLMRADNLFSCIIFNGGLFLLAFSLVPACVVMCGANNGQHRISGIAGLFSLSGVLGLALTPWDVMPVGHIVALVVWLVALLVMVATFALEAVANGKDIAGLMALSLVVLLLMYLFVSEQDQRKSAVMQKALVIATIGWFGHAFSLIWVIRIRIRRLSNLEQQRWLTAAVVRHLERNPFRRPRPE